MDPSTGGVFCESRTSSTAETPKKLQTVESYVGTSSRLAQSTESTESMDDTFVIEKMAEDELEIYKLQLCSMPNYFPELFSSERDPNNEALIAFYFEYMTALVSEFDNTLDDSLLFNGLEDGLNKALKFILELTHCLYVLHDYLRLVHSDISLRNILYCEKYEIWKLNDFGQTMRSKLLEPLVQRTSLLQSQLKAQFLRSNQTFTHWAKYS